MASFKCLQWKCMFRLVRNKVLCTTFETLGIGKLLLPLFQVSTDKSSNKHGSSAVLKSDMLPAIITTRNKHDISAKNRI